MSRMYRAETDASSFADGECGSAPGAGATVSHPGSVNGAESAWNFSGAVLTGELRGETKQQGSPQAGS